MKQLLHLKSLLIALLVLFGGGSVSAQEETIYYENFGTTTTEISLKNYDSNWTVVSGGYVNLQNNVKYGSSGRSLQMGSKNSPSADVITPTFGASGNITFSCYMRTNNSNESVTLSVEDAGTITAYSGATSTLADNKVTVKFKKEDTWYLVSLTLTGCTSSTRIRIKNIRTLFVDDVTVKGDADTRIPVTLEYSADKHTTATESGEITGAPTLKVDPPAAASEVVFSSSNENVAKFEAGKLIAVAPGTTTITASISGSKTYRDAKDEYTLTVGLPSSNLTYNPKSVTVTYDKKNNFTAPELSYTGGYDGTITYTSSNESVATVDASSGEVTINAVGETTITASGADTPYLKASKDFYTLIVKDIQGSVVGGGTGGSVFKETFNNADSNGGNEGGFSNASNQYMNKDEVCDNVGWIGGMFKAKECVKIGKGKETWPVTTPAITVEPNVPYTLSFKAAPWGTESNVMNISVTGGNITNMTGSMTNEQWNDFSATITPESNQITIAFSVTGGNRFFLDEINVVAPTTDETVEVTIPASGWGTYCCQWPLDFTAAPEGLKAVSATSATNVTLSEITQKLKGGTGIIINGTPGKTYTIKVADKGTEYEGTNMLTGTLAPTYVEEGQYFLKSGKFVYSSAGILPDKKAYLKSDGTGTQGAKLSFLFDTTSIEQFKTEASDDAWYDLSGRKVNPSTNVKGVYIHNGKKVVK